VRRPRLLRPNVPTIPPLAPSARWPRPRPSTSPGSPRTRCGSPRSLSAGRALSVLQTAQRIGSAAGIAITGSVFYNRLASSHGDFASAFRDGIVSIAAFVAAALALTLADALTRDR
jgi:hypothetical protein